MGGALACVVLALAVAAPSGSGAAAAAAVPGCGAFEAQGDAQEAFVEAGGSPARNAGRMDRDRDGVACEALPGPFEGYATIGYNRKRHFLYGVVTLPAGAGGGQAPCLYGDRVSPEGSRAFQIFRVRGDGDRPLLGRYGGGTEARPELGQLLWKVDRRRLPSGRYYIVFEERIRTNPYGGTECPGFSSRPTLLPRPKS